VVVHQEPASKDEKGVDVLGDTLYMKYRPEGNLLEVTGDLAQLRQDKIYILGPTIEIDQATNKAWVQGAGAMQMESTTNFNGDPLLDAQGKPKPVPMTVHWTDSMLFTGKSAEFQGGVQAEQENSRLACQFMQVFFDEPISLKQGAKSDKPARVRNMV